VLDLVEQPGNFLLMGLPDKELAGLKSASASISR
jgi:hypothetical protein